MKNSDGSPVPEKDAFFESMNVVGAGAGTTAISTRAINRYACSSPRVYKKLQEEIDSANFGGKLSPSVQFTEGQNLSYFQTVIMEALRLFPAGEFKEYSTNETLSEYHKSASSYQGSSPMAEWRSLAIFYERRYILPHCREGAFIDIG
jgi:cytochrome P450